MSKILLLVEDDPLISRMYEKAFKAVGFELKIATNGDEAMSTLKTMNPKSDAIIIDVMMPKKSGFDVLREIKADESLKNIPAILLTNLSGQHDIEKGLSLGATSYIVKSQYSLIEIVEKVKEITNVH